MTGGGISTDNWTAFSKIPLPDAGDDPAPARRLELAPDLDQQPDGPVDPTGPAGGEPESDASSPAAAAVEEQVPANGPAATTPPSPGPLAAPPSAAVTHAPPAAGDAHLGRTSVSRPRAGDALVQGRRMSAADLAMQRKARQYADHVMGRLIARDVSVSATTVEVAAGTIQVDVTLTRRAGALDTLLDAVAAEFSGPEVDIEIVSDWAVRLWVPLEAETPARQRGAWIPAELRDRVRAHLEVTGESVTQLVLRAYNAHHAEIHGLFGADQAPEGPLRVSNARRRSDLGTTVQLWMYLKKQHEVQLDEATASSGAGSRSALITALLERYLAAHGA